MTRPAAIMRKPRSVLRRAAAAGIVALAATATTAFVSGLPSRAPTGRLSRAKPVLAAIAEPPAAPVRAAFPPTAQWVLPSVDKDVHDFIQGRAEKYAFVQTSEILYLFAPYPGSADDLRDVAPKVTLDIKEEGKLINLVVEGEEILKGPMAHSIKPGSDIWMIEEGPTGMMFVVVELDKNIKGREWTSVMEPTVTWNGDYSQTSYSYPIMSEEDQEATVADTLKHVQGEFASMVNTTDGYECVDGDMMTVDIQGFQMGPDGEKGAPMDAGASSGVKFELGNTGSGGLMPEIHEALVGAFVGESRDVTITLGARGGAMGGQQIIVSVTVTAIQKRELPELDDDFAKQVKRKEQFAQAGTIEGIPEEEQGLADIFTLEMLRNEILSEVRDAAQKEAQADVKDQLLKDLFSKAEVECEFGDLSQKGTRSQGAKENIEKEAAMIQSCLEREGLDKLLDLDGINKATWDKLSEPQSGDKIAEVGNDPDRDFQSARRVIIRKARQDQVLAYLENVAEIISG